MADAYAIRDDLVWPSELNTPARPPAVVYLDQNHFVNMARVAAGQPIPGYAELLEACRKSLTESRAVFPLSLTHLLETGAISSHARREAVAEVMEELSGYDYLLGREAIQLLEIEETVRAMGIDLPYAGGADLIGRGGMHSLKRLDDTDSAEDDALEGRGFRERQMWMLTGGVEGHAQGKHFWQSMMGYRAHREVRQARAIDETRWMQERLRDVVAANELYNYLNEKIAGVIEDRITFAELLPELNDARRFTDGMPSTRVAITVKTHYHRNGRHRWRDNDMYDIDMISVAVPYCDAVYTDKAVRNALVTNDEVEILFGTFMPRRPEQLIDWLHTRPAPHELVAGRNASEPAA